MITTIIGRNMRVFGSVAALVALLVAGGQPAHAVPSYAAGVHCLSRQFSRTDALWPVLQADRLYDRQGCHLERRDQLCPAGGDGAGIGHID